MSEVYNAVTKNNSNVGGGYIEKQSDQYSIRGIGLIEDMQDLQDVVVKTEHGTPIYLKQIASVEYGEGLRVGAVTQDGKGEVVTGIVMMLKEQIQEKWLKEYMKRYRKLSLLCQKV